MALNFPSNPSLNDVYTDDNAVSWVFDGVKWDVFKNDASKNFYGTKLTFLENTMLSSVLTPLAYGSEVYDTGGFYNSSTDANKIFFNRAGFYRVNIQIVTSSFGSGASYNVRIRKNGSIILQDDTMAANQASVYDETVEFAQGDYIEILASEDNGIGMLTTDTFVEVALIGYSPSSTIGNIFSGANVKLTAAEGLSSTPTAITWDQAVYNLNANVLGDLYYNASQPTRLTIYTTAHYNIKGSIVSGTSGGDNSYTITLRKNGSVILDSVTLSANEIASIDSIYELNQNDYIEVFASNSGSIGTIVSNSYLQIIRLGV